MTDRLWPDARVERWLADRHSTMIHELGAFLDGEAGLRETMISARYTELLADLGDVFDIVASPTTAANVAASDPANEIDSRAAATLAAPPTTLSRPLMARRPRPPRRRGIAELATFVIVIVVLFGLAGGLPRDSTVSRFGSVPTGRVSLGYVRLAHLSPDTPKLDVYLSKVGDRSFKRKRFTEVSYEWLSNYLPLAVGTYAVSMRPAGAPESDPAVLMTQVTVEDGATHTVAVVGHFANLGLKVLTDDLSRPPPNRVKVRIIQASIGAPVLDVTLPDGTAIAKDVQFATTTPYQLVSPGTLKLRLKPSGSGSTSPVNAVFNAGSIYSLLILDGHNGRLKVEITPDIQGTTVVPRGTVMVGAGGTARRSLGSVAYVGLLAVLILALALALGPLARLTRAAVHRRARRDDVPMIWPRRRRTRLAGRGLELAGWISSLAALVVLAAAVVASTLPQRPEPPAAAVVRLPDCQFSGCEPVRAPPGYPARVRIPSIRVDSSLEVLGRDRAGALQPPRSYERAGWFGEGVIPGDAGPAVIVGHVDSSNGRAVFYDLHQLRAGDAIDVLRDGEWITFRVTVVEQHPASKFPTDQVYGATPGAELRLITCGGAFDRRTLSYRNVTVVYAVLVASDNE